MPAPGNQHASNIANPFAEGENRISEYTATQIATLQSRLEKQLGPEYLSSRSGPSGQKVHYITAEKCIQLANEVFGFNGWSSSIQNIQVDFVEEHPQTLKVSLGLSVIVRVTLRDGTYHEDIGYGHMENCKGKAAAFEKAKKEGTTDALKRALRNFGNVLGNCIYDKAYLAKVSKMKVEPTKFDEQNLHRHGDFTRTETIKKEAAAAEAAKKANEESQVLDSYDDIFAEFDEVDFTVADDDGHPDEVVLTDADRSTLNENRVPNQPAPQPAAMQPPTRPMARTASEGSNYRNRSGAPQTPNQQQAPRPNQFPGGAQFNGAHNQPNNQVQRPVGQQLNQNRQQPQQNNGGAGNHVNRPQPQQNNTGYNNNSNKNRSNGYNGTNSGTATQPNTTSSGSSNQTPQQPANPNPPPPQAVPEGTTVGFFSARAVKEIPEDKLATGAVLAPQPAMAFNPRADSPSIRKTPGIDHTKSKPVGRGLTHVQPKPTSTQEAAIGAAGGLGGARPAAVRPANVVNPQFDTTRRIGAPGGPGSPLANRGQYRPPTVLKRPTPGDGGAVGGGVGLGRAPLSDVSNNAGGVAIMGVGRGTATGPDVKRQKMG